MSYGTYVLHNYDAGAPTYGTGIGGLIPVFDGFLVSLLSWTKTTWATNQVSYQAPAGTNQRILSLDDTNANYSIVLGWEALSAWNTGTGQFPTSAQQTTGLYIQRQTTLADVSWRFYGTQALFHFYCTYDATSFSNIFTFGDISSYLSTTDSYATVIRGSAVNTLTAIGNGGQISSQIQNASVGCYLDRSYTQTGTSVTASFISELSKQSSYANPYDLGIGTNTYPDLVTGGLLLSPLWVGEASAAVVRGYLPGIWNMLQARALIDTNTFTGNSGLANGRSFECTWIVGTSGCVAFETSNTWGGI